MTAKLITTPIYYVNDKPHIGHAYTTIASDALARFWKAQGHDVVFATGTDEHGSKVQKSALNAGVEPLEYADTISQHFRQLVGRVDASPDDFIRTTEPRHAAVVVELWNRLVERGFIYHGNYGGWYSLRDECFYTELETELRDGVRYATLTGTEVQWVEEDSYFFKLQSLQEKLLEFYDANPSFIQPSTRRNEVVSFVKSGLVDLSVSRNTVSWGIPVPGDDKHTIYVWIDALANYITVAGGLDKWNEVDAIHIVGKDILRFHAVYWVAILIAAGLKVPSQIFAHGWWTASGNKIGKSAGNAINVEALIDSYGIDAVRYYLLRAIPFGSDGDFVEHDLIHTYNTELANGIGNLLNRTVTLVHKNIGDRVPEQISVDVDVLKIVGDHVRKAHEYFSNLRFRDGLDELRIAVDFTGKYFTAKAPWSKDCLDIPVVLFTTLSAIHHIAANGLSCISPSGVERINAQTRLYPNAVIPTPTAAFPRIVT